MDDLPFLDAHEITVAAPRPVVWAALRRYADRSLRIGSGPLARLLGTVPRTGFAVDREVPGQLLSLAGRHRFSRYRLAFELTDGGPGGTVVTARSYAVFPGPHGFVYRTLVVGSRGHVVAVRRMLTAIRRNSLD